MKEFVNIDPAKIPGNFIDLIGNKWMLVTAEKDGVANTMTASWGGAGFLWGAPAAFVFVRPQRYTFEFTEASDELTLSFFDDRYHDALSLCGRVSGRDHDKFAEAGLTLAHRNGMPCFEEASLTLYCCKKYADFLHESAFTDKSPLKNYAAGDFHKMYICEIVGADVAQ